MYDVFTQGAAIADALRKAAKLADDIKNVEMREALLALREYLNDVREANSNLRAENNQLREQLKNREELTFAENLYWRVGSDGKRDGPYCPKCYGDRNKVNPLAFHKREPGYGGVDYYSCPVCGHNTIAGRG